MTVQSIAVAGLLNVAVQLQIAEKVTESYSAYSGVGIVTLAILWGARRLRKLDNFEKQITQGGGFMNQ